MKSSTVSAEIGLRLVVPQQTIVPLVASFHYSSDDPYAIRIAFHVGLDEPVEWTFARDLLANGVKGRDGLGDVAIWPGAATGTSADTTLHIELSSPFGEAHFEAPIPDVSDFLRRTYQVAPLGEETRFIDFDAALTDFLSQP